MYFLGVDFGGGSCKATLLSAAGKVEAEFSAEYPTVFTPDGGAEQQPEMWLRAALDCITYITRRVRPEEIKCLCFSAATHTAVLTDEYGRPLCPSVYWTDTRSAPDAEELDRLYGEEILSKTLHRPSPVWTIAQLKFIRRVRPEIFKNIRRITFAKDYVRRFFTGDFVTDRIEAEGSMFYDVAAGRWDEKLCALAGITPDMLPEVVDCLDVAGNVTDEASGISGLKKGTLVIAGTTDTAAEVFANGCINAGDVSVKFATAGRICVISDRPAVNPGVINYSHLKKGLWYPGSATKSCAASMRWFRDGFGGEYGELDEAAERTPAGAEGLIFSPHLSGELTPYNNPHMRGAFNGVSGIHTKGHFARAVMEGAAFSMRDCLNELRAVGLPAGDKAVFLGGAAKSPLWRQIAADILGLTLTVRDNCDSSFGGAMLAGIGCGEYGGFSEALRICAPRSVTIAPDESRRLVYDEAFSRYKELAAFYDRFYGGRR